MSYSNVRFTVNTLDPTMIVSPTIVNGDTIITPVPKQGLDTVVSVRGKKALFIGDSHTANHDWGWQVIVCKKTGLILNNTAVIGKHLPWMVNVANMGVTKNFDYCFIYGGANDIHGNRNPYLVVKMFRRLLTFVTQKG